MGSDKQFEQKYLRDHKYRFKKVINCFASVSKKIKILDIGTTPFTFYIKERFPDFDVATIDLNNSLEERCIERNIAFKSCDLEKDSIPFENEYFDIVIFSEVIEHLFTPPSKVMNEIKRILKKEGELIFTTPNVASLYKRICLALGNNPMPPLENLLKESWNSGHGHIREYNMKECLGIIKAAGFQVEQRNYLQPLFLKSNHCRAIRLIYDIVCLMIPFIRETIFIKCRVGVAH